jgi:hypothetical protein
MERDGPATGPLDRRLVALTDDVRADEAAAERRRRGALGRQAAEEGTLAGTLVDLAERGADLSLTTGPGRTVRGHVVALGHDHVVVEAADGSAVHVALHAISLVQVAPGSTATSGDRVVARRRSLSSVLADLHAQQRPVLVQTATGDTVAGSLHAVGVDVVAIGTPTGRVVYVAQAAITEVTAT